MQAEIRWALTAQPKSVFPSAVYGLPPCRLAASIGPATTRTQATPAALRAGPPEQWWIGIVKPLGARRASGPAPRQAQTVHWTVCVRARLLKRVLAAT